MNPREAAFGERPHAPVRMAGCANAEERWLAAVALGGQGRYAAASTVLQALMADPGVPPAVAAHAAVTTASHRRQLGGHAGARRFDALGLRLATEALGGGAAIPRPDPDGTGAAAARVDALVGLAADALGTAQPEVAQRLLDVAGHTAPGIGSWRLDVRLGWVRAELALLRGRPADAVAPARSALERATAAGSVRHRLKSGIVLTVAAAAAGELDRTAAVGRLDAALAECERHGLLPLLPPCYLASADLMGGTANERVTRMAQRSAADTTNDAARRRHAAAHAMSVIYHRSDPYGKCLLGDSLWRT